MAVPVVFYLNDEDDRQKARDLLQSVDATHLTEFDEAVEAQIETDDAANLLLSSGLPVEFPQGLPENVPQLASASDSLDYLFPRAKLGDHDRELLKRFKSKSSFVKLTQAHDASYGSTMGALKSAEISNEPRVEKLPAIDGFAVEGLPNEATEYLPPDDQLLETDFYRARLAGAMRPAWHAQLTELGAEITGFEAPDTYDMRLHRNQVADVGSLDFVLGVKRYGVVETVSPEFRHALESSEVSHAAGAETATFEVALHRPDDRDDVIRFITSATGKTVLDSGGAYIRFTTEVASPVLAALANLPQVSSLHFYEPPGVMVSFARDIVGVTQINWNTAPSPWTGDNETIAIVDSGVDTTHPDLVAVKTIPYRSGSANDVNGHGSHVAGIIAGSGAASGGIMLGVAPGAAVVSLGAVDLSDRLDLPADYAEFLELVRDEGAKIINLSWGIQYNGDYQFGSKAVDQFVYDNPEILVVVAAGNSGRAPAGHHLLQTLGMPASAKNIVTVGASATSRDTFAKTWSQLRQGDFPVQPAGDELVAGNPDFVAALSGRGPTNSDMVKPDVVAPGTLIAAPRAATFRQPEPTSFTMFSNRYAYLNGTSMATPVVAGAAAIVRQYLREVFGISNPTAALLKSILVASTHRMSNSAGFLEADKVGYPDFEQGFGRIDLAAVLPDPQSPGQKIHVVDIRNGSLDALASRQPIGGPRKSRQSYKFHIGAGATEPLRIVVSWTDVPGRSVQHDLHLTVTLPDGTKVPGNTGLLATRPSYISNTAFYNDRHNTTELVSIVAPAAGSYLATIIARDTPFAGDPNYGPQGYGLCVRGQLTSPPASVF